MPTLVVDACLLITLGAADALWLLAELDEWKVVTCQRAIGEVQRPPASHRVRRGIDDGWLELVSVDVEDDQEAEALARYDNRPAFRNRADAEILALASIHGFVVGSDDRQMRAEARRFGRDRVAGCIDLLVLHARSGRLGLDEAQSMLTTLDIPASVDLRDLI